MTITLPTGPASRPCRRLAAALGAATLVLSTRGGRRPRNAAYR